jgi:ADP-ribose pyrophosphatase YjhB (NUDIX family)
VALGVVRRAGQLLLIEGYDSVKDEHFLRFVGGGIEFGERAADALVREFEEELGVAVETGRRLGVIENIFTYEGEPGHEILFLLEVTFSDNRLYERAEWTLRNSKASQARWQPIASLDSGPPLYPEQASDLIRAEKRSPNESPEAGS